MLFGVTNNDSSTNVDVALAKLVWQWIVTPAIWRSPKMSRGDASGALPAADASSPTPRITPVLIGNPAQVIFDQANFVRTERCLG